MSCRSLQADRVATKGLNSLTFQHAPAIDTNAWMSDCSAASKSTIKGTELLISTIKGTELLIWTIKGTEHLMPDYRPIAPITTAPACAVYSPDCRTRIRPARSTTKACTLSSGNPICRIMACLSP
jgi:hypothetical protein